MAYVLTGASEWKKVKNLGWLLNNWNDVEKFVVTSPNSIHFYNKSIGELVELPEKDQSLPDCWLIAFLRSGRIYATTFASRGVLKDWLVRPKFMTLPIEWFGIKTQIPDSKKGW